MVPFVFRVSAGGRTGIMGNGHRRIKHNAQVQLASPRHAREVTSAHGARVPGRPRVRGAAPQCTLTACPPADHSQPALARTTGATCSGQSTKKRRLGVHARHRPSSLPIHALRVELAEPRQLCLLRLVLALWIFEGRSYHHGRIYSGCQ